MVGVGYLAIGMFVMLSWHVSVVKIPSKANLMGKRPLNVPKTTIHETIYIII
jgi:hypothetical protein